MLLCNTHTLLCYNSLSKGLGGNKFKFENIKNIDTSAWEDTQLNSLAAMVHVLFF